MARSPHHGLAHVFVSFRFIYHDSPLPFTSVSPHHGPKVIRRGSYGGIDDSGMCSRQPDKAPTGVLQCCNALRSAPRLFFSLLTFLVPCYSRPSSYVVAHPDKPTGDAMDSVTENGPSIYRCMPTCRAFLHAARARLLGAMTETFWL